MLICGVVWCVVLCCVDLWCDVMWCGVMWCDVVWCGVPCAVSINLLLIRYPLFPTFSLCTPLTKPPYKLSAIALYPRYSTLFTLFLDSSLFFALLSPYLFLIFLPLFFNHWQLSSSLVPSSFLPILMFLPLLYTNLAALLLLCIQILLTTIDF